MANESSKIHHVTYRYSELNETNSIFDYLVAAGSDSDRMLQWSVWVVVTSIVALFVASVLLSILCNSKTRKSGFNLYLVFLMIPDFLFSFLCSVNCSLNLSVGSYISEGWCWFQSYYVIFSIGANSWLNGLVAYHIYELLQRSFHRQRYIPPSRRRVILNSGLVYVWSAFVASWIFWNKLPHQPGLQNGVACLPVMYSTESMIFFFTAFIPLLVGVPALYVIYVAIQIWRRNLLPSIGRTRNVSIFIARLILVFLVMWFPSLVLMFVASFWIQPWAAWAGGTWSHLQGAVSAAVCLMKPDVGAQYLKFITCGAYSKMKADNSESTEMYISGWMAPPSIDRLYQGRRQRGTDERNENNQESLSSEGLKKIEIEIQFGPDDSGSSGDDKHLSCSLGDGFGVGIDDPEPGEEDGSVEKISPFPFTKDPKDDEDMEYPVQPALSK